MIDTQLVSLIIGIFIGLGTLVAGIGFAYAQFKSGGEKYKDNLIETLKETAEAERKERGRVAIEKTEMLLSHQAQITELTKEIAMLKGRFEEQAQKAMEYKELLLGRDPELQKTLNEIRSYLKHITSQTTTNEIRNEEIDNDTKSETGKILRKKV